MKDNLKSLLEIKNLTEQSADLYFYGDIVNNWWGAWDDADQYPESIKNFLDGAKGKDLNIYINSGGGSVFAGMAIYNMLKRHNGYKTVQVDGLAGSIASIIALAGDKVIIPNNAYFMIHKPWNLAYGNANELREMADQLDLIEEGLINVYKDNLKDNVDIETIKEFINQETWFTGIQASEYFNIETTNGIDAVACSSNFRFENKPKSLKIDNHVPKVKNIEHKNSKKEITEKERLLLELELI